MTALALARHPARTQAERSAATRARIVRAVVECVEEDGILRAVLDDTFACFVARAWAHFDGPHYRTTLEFLLHSLPALTATLPRELGAAPP